MVTKKHQLKATSNKYLSLKKFALALFFIIGLGGYFSYFNTIVEQPSINYLATGLDPEEAAYLQKAIVKKPSPTATPKGNMQYGTEPVLVVPKTTPPVQKTPVPNGIEAEEAVFIQKVINKENTNTVGTAPAPIVSVTTQDANGNFYTAPIVLNKPTEDKNGIEKSADAIASEIKQEVIESSKLKTGPSKITSTPKKNDLTVYEGGGFSRALFCQREGVFIPQGTFLRDSSNNLCYFCRVKTAGGSAAAELVRTNYCFNPVYTDNSRSCILYQKNDEGGIPQYFFSTKHSYGFDKVIYYPKGSNITYFDESSFTRKATCIVLKGHSVWK